MFSLESSLLPCAWLDAKTALESALRGHWPQPGEGIYRIDDTYMLLRGEQSNDGSRELVVVALTGDMAQGTLAALNHARANGFDSIRAHFFKRGAERYIQRKLKLPVREIERRGEDERILQIRFSDMGGSSKSKNTTTTTTTTTNVSGTAATSGDNYGMMLSGVNDSDINLSMTDHGAIAVAGSMAEEAFNFGSMALESNESITEGAFGFGADALDANSKVSTHAIDAMTNVAGQQSATTKAAISMANSAKAREQTGTNESDNSLLKTVSLIVGIAGTLVTIVVILGNKK